MKIISSCNICNLIRGYLLLAAAIIVFLPIFSKKHELSIPVTPMQVSVFLMIVGSGLFLKRIYDTYAQSNLDQDS
ncbi:MAG: hypothetical protein ACPGPR_05240 [Paracoccaceae bacterium]